MKKFFVFILLVVAGYFAYEYLIKEKEVYQIKDTYSKMREGVDIDAPSISPRDFAHYEGTFKNVSDKVLTNIVISYLIDAQVSEAKISRVEPNEEVQFKSNAVMLRHMDPPHYLKEVIYEQE
jgi:hypothetical protein